MDSDEVVHVPIEDAIDLHAFSPRDVVNAASDYLEAAQAAGFDLVRLIHGRGKGVQRAAVRRMLQTHPAVIEFWDAPDAHLGATLVKLKPRASDPSTRAPLP
jgi:DNA-nicking Smr family endonuclease